MMVGARASAAWRVWSRRAEDRARGGESRDQESRGGFGCPGSLVITLESVSKYKQSS